MRLRLVLPLLAFASAAVAAPDPALKTFLAKFADSAARNAPDAMAKLTRFPLKNRVYQQPERISAAGFAHAFALNDFRQQVACLKSTPPQKAPAASADLGEWEVECDGQVFYFARVGAEWRFTGFENVNE